MQEKLGVDPKTKLSMEGCEDAVIMKKLEVPHMGRELETMYRRIDRRVATFGAMTQADVEREIQRYRRERRPRVAERCA